LKVVAVLILAATSPSVAFARATPGSRAAELSRAYLAVWSSNEATTLPRLKQVYAPQVRFYGRVLNHSGLLSEKRRFMKRWPVRRYALVPETVRVSCAAQGSTCTVTGLIQWKAENRARRAAAQGFSRFSQTFDFSLAKPMVVAETGSVLKQGRRSRRGRSA